MSLKVKDGMLGFDHQHGRHRSASLEQIRAFLAGSEEVRFAGQRREEVYGWVEMTLVRLQYASLAKPDKGLVRRYLSRMTGSLGVEGRLRSRTAFEGRSINGGHRLDLPASASGDNKAVTRHA
jgi:hypothetical protein